MLDCFEINENTARSQRTNLNYLICLKLHGFFSCWGHIKPSSMGRTVPTDSKLDICFVFCKTKTFLSVKWKQLFFKIIFLKSFDDQSSRHNNSLEWLRAPIDIRDNCGCLIYITDSLLKQKKSKTPTHIPPHRSLRTWTIGWWTFCFKHIWASS